MMRSMINKFPGVKNQTSILVWNLNISIFLLYCTVVLTKYYYADERYIFASYQTLFVYK